VAIVISQRHVSDIDPAAMRVAGVLVELVFTGAHQLDALLCNIPCGFFFKDLYVKIEHPKLYQYFFKDLYVKIEHPMLYQYFVKDLCVKIEHPKIYHYFFKNLYVKIEYPKLYQ
jgi:hypothetical protein